MTAPPRDSPGVIAPPPLIYLPALVLGFVFDRLWPITLIPAYLRYTVGTLLALVSLAIVSFALREFRRGRTHFDVRKAATTLLTSGPFRFSRNPSYLSLTLLWIGIGVLTDNVWIGVWLLPALVLVHYGVIRREERYLERKFGEAYRDYRAKVRRWL